MTKHKRYHNLVRGGLAVFVLSLLFNFVWESIHAVLLYEGHANYVASFFTRMVIYSSFMDALLILGIFFMGCAFFKGDCWLESYKGKEVIFTAIVGLFIAAILELKAVWLDQWSYNSYMPTIFGIGLSPLVQLAITGSLSMFLVSRFFYNHNN